MVELVKEGDWKKTRDINIAVSNLKAAMQVTKDIIKEHGDSSERFFRIFIDGLWNDLNELIKD